MIAVADVLEAATGFTGATAERRSRPHDSSHRKRANFAPDSAGASAGNYAAARLPVVRYIDINACGIQMTNDEVPLDIVLQAPSGIALATFQIARAIRDHKGQPPVFMPHHVDLIGCGRDRDVEFPLSTSFAADFAQWIPVGMARINGIRPAQQPVRRRPAGQRPSAHSK
jgi:hypothetical protein